MKLALNRSTIVVGVTLGLVLLVILYCVGHLWVLRQGYVSEIELIKPRTARLLGMLDSSDQIKEAHSEAAIILDEIAYPVLRDSAATAAAMQKEIRELMTDAGLSISGSQVLPRQAEQGFDRLTLDITAEGNTGALEQALAELESMRPVVFVKSVNIKPARVSRRRSRNREEPTIGDARKVTARFQLISLRLKN